MLVRAMFRDILSRYRWVAGGFCCAPVIGLAFRAIVLLPAVGRVLRVLPYLLVGLKCRLRPAITFRPHRCGDGPTAPLRFCRICTAVGNIWIDNSCPCVSSIVMFSALRLLEGLLRLAVVRANAVGWRLQEMLNGRTMQLYNLQSDNILG